MKVATSLTFFLPMVDNMSAISKMLSDLDTIQAAVITLRSDVLELVKSEEASLSKKRKKAEDTRETTPTCQSSSSKISLLCPFHVQLHLHTRSPPQLQKTIHIQQHHQLHPKHTLLHPDHLSHTNKKQYDNHTHKNSTRLHIIHSQQNPQQATPTHS